MRKMLLIVLCIGMLMGCAGIGGVTQSHTNPIEEKIVNEKFTNASTESVWNTMVKELATSYFMINNINKESRIINVSFSVRNPENYIDCGDSIVNTDIPSCNREKRRKETYYYETARSNKFTSGFMSPGGVYGTLLPSVAYMYRETSLNGRMNIYIAPKDNGTLVTINVRYIFSVTVHQKYVNCAPAGNTINGGNTVKSYTCGFNTGVPGKTYWEGEPLTCITKGTIEQEILSLVP